MNSQYQVVNIVGRSGAGKQGVADLLTATGFSVLSASYLLVTHGKDNVKRMVREGILVPDEIAIPIFLDAIRKSALGDLALDGLIRTEAQYRAIMPTLKSMGFERLWTIHVHVSEELAVERMRARKRSDDTPEFIQDRLLFFKEQTQPLLMNFREDTEFYTIDNSGPRENLSIQFAQILHRDPVMV